MYNKIPNIIVVHAIIFIFLILSIMPDSTKKYPTIITGSEETKILVKRILFFIKLKISFRK